MTLKDEIAKPEYEGMTDAEIADALNGKMVAVLLDTPVAEVSRIIVPTGELFAITMQSEARPPTELVGVCWNFSRMLDRWNSIGTSEPGVAEAVAGSMAKLQDAKLLSADSASKIAALGVGEVTYLSTIGATSPLNAADIANARAE